MPKEPFHLRYTTSNINLNMADAAKPQLRASKRKRTQVNYYEEPVSDDEMSDVPEVDEDEGESEAEVKKSSRAKVCALHPMQLKLNVQTY